MDTVPFSSTSSTLATAVPPVKVIFLDIPAGVAIDEVFDLSNAYYDFASLLTRLSGSVSERIRGLDPFQLSAKGFSVPHGCWWYRIVKFTQSDQPDLEWDLPRLVKGNWFRVATLYAYNQMREAASILAHEVGWIEVQHDLQKKRDELQEVEAQKRDKNWRSSIGAVDMSLHKDKSVDSSHFVTGLSSAITTSKTSAHGTAETSEKVGATEEDTDTESVGSCTPTTQMKNLIQEYQIRVHPLVIEWPEPPLCNLIHLNEKQVSQEARSRYHLPIHFQAFTKGKEQTEGLPSLTPRPGPFPAQIGTPPSQICCAYEIHNDIEYPPNTPQPDEVIPPTVESQASAVHNARYGNAISEVDPIRGILAPFADDRPPQTSTSLPDQRSGYDNGNNVSYQLRDSINSAPAHVQSFQQLQANDIRGCPGAQRSSSQETYARASDHASYRGTDYLDSGTFNPRPHLPPHSYQSQSFNRSPSGPRNPDQFSYTPPALFGNHSAVSHPSYPPQPQEVVPRSASYGKTGFSFNEPSLRNFSEGVFPINTDAMKESEILSMRAQSQQYYGSSETSRGPSRQPTPTQFSRPSIASQRSSRYPPARTYYQYSGPSVPLKFSRKCDHGTLAPAFATVDDFSQSFEIASGLDPALDVNNSEPRPAYYDRQHRKHRRDAGPSGQQEIRWNPKRFQIPQYYLGPNIRSVPISGQFSPPKPRVKHLNAVNAINRYYHGDSANSPSRGRNVAAEPSSAAHGSYTNFEPNMIPAVTTTNSLAETRSSADETGHGISQGYNDSFNLAGSSARPDIRVEMPYAGKTRTDLMSDYRPFTLDAQEFAMKSGSQSQSRTSSKIFEYTNGKNTGTQLSDYIKLDNAQSYRRNKSKTPASGVSSSSPSHASSASNFSDDFMLNGNGASKKKGKAKENARRRGKKRGTDKETDAVTPGNAEEHASNEQELANGRAARARRRSEGRAVHGKEYEDGGNKQTNGILAEGDVMMNEG